MGQELLHGRLFSSKEEGMVLAYRDVTMKALQLSVKGPIQLLQLGGRKSCKGKTLLGALEAATEGSMSMVPVSQTGTCTV